MCERKKERVRGEQVGDKKDKKVLRVIVNLKLILIRTKFQLSGISRKSENCQSPKSVLRSRLLNMIEIRIPVQL